MRTVAAFDFDGTLTRRDSLLPFLLRTRGRSRTLLAVGALLPRFLSLAVGRGDRDGTKAALFERLLTGVPFDDLARAGAAYGEELAERKISPQARERVAWHRARGHEVVIVSASLDVYLGTVAHALDIERAICTRLEVGTDGRCTGRMDRGNCRGPAKAVRLRDHLGGVPTELWAYGDSAGDNEMFAMADHVVRARRGRLMLTS